MIFYFLFFFYYNYALIIMPKLIHNKIIFINIKENLNDLFVDKVKLKIYTYMYGK